MDEDRDADTELGLIDEVDADDIEYLDEDDIEDLDDFEYADDEVKQ